MNLSAIIFDLDGTVLADEDEYGEAFNRVLRKFGIETGSEYPHIAGIGVEENWTVFLKKFKIKTDETIADLSRQTQEEYVKLLPKVKLKTGFKKFINEVHKNNIVTALATSNTWAVVEKVLDQFNIKDFFDGVTTGEEVGAKKPSPQIFTITADKIGMDSSNCLVIEDSEAGVEAAHAAGMKVVGIARDGEHKKNLKQADLVIENFTELSLEKLKSL